MGTKTIDDFYAKYGVREVREQSYQDEFRELMEAVFAADDRIVMVAFKGYTPGFNDGDPCYHSGDYAIFTTEGMTSYDEMIWHDVEEDATDSSRPEDAVLINNLLGMDLHKPISSHAIDMTPKLDKKIKMTIAGQDLVENIWETNYYVKVVRSGSGVKIESESYYCGY